MSKRQMVQRVGHFTVWDFPDEKRHAVRCDYVPGPVIRYFLSRGDAVAFAEAQYRAWQARERAQKGAER